MKRNKDRNFFRFSVNGNFYTNCLNNVYYFIVDKQGNPDLASAREQFPCLVFDDDPDHQDSVFLNQYDGFDKGQQTIAEFFVLCNQDDLLERPGRDLADKIEAYFQRPAQCANATEMWLQEEIKKKAVFDLVKDTAKVVEKDPDHIFHMGPDDELMNLSEHALGFIDQNIVDKISLNTYLNNMFK